MAERQAQFPDPLNSHAQPEVLPASISQQGLWFLAQLEPDSKAYNIPIGLRLRGLLRPEVLEQSLQAIINRHESLRTTFELRDRQLLQLVSTTTNFHLNITDLSDCSESQIETEAYSHAEGEVNKVFDLTRGPLFRVVVFKLRPNEHVLICMMHHIISDAWSTGVLVQELAHYYEAFSTDMDYRPKPLELQYGDYAVWQHEWSQSEAFLGQLEYWKQKLAGAPPLLELPYDRARPAEHRSKGWAQIVALDPALVEHLKVVAQNNGATFFMIMLAAFTILLYRYSCQTDILVGIPVAGRDQVETESLIGLFVNVIVLRLDLSGNPRFTTLLAQVRDRMLEALANQDVPFEMIVQELQPTRSLSYNPVFQVMFATFKDPAQSRRFADLVATPYSVTTATARLDLSGALIEGVDGRWWIKLEYDTALFDHDRMKRMLAHYEQLLRNIIETS